MELEVPTLKSSPRLGVGGCNPNSQEMLWLLQDLSVKGRELCTLFANTTNIMPIKVGIIKSNLRTK